MTERDAAADPGTDDVPAPPASGSSGSPGSPGPKTELVHDLVHDVVVPVARVAIGGVVSAAVNHVASGPGPPRNTTSTKSEPAARAE